LKLIVRKAAEADLKEARDWYDTQQAGPGDAFVTEAGRAFSRMIEGPERFPLQVKSLRRCQMRRFPYSIYFIERGDKLVVLAVLHQRRDPKVCKGRLR
jgi:plasmid stabilization system protein ParE